MNNVRALAAKTVQDVAYRGRSLSTQLPPILAQCKPRDKGLLQALCYGALRYHFRLKKILQLQMSKPLKTKDSDIESLLIVGLYQLIYMRTPGHAAVSEAVTATQALKKGWAKGLVNGVLRNCQRNLDTLQAQADTHYSSQYAHPEWLIKKLQRAWPEQWQEVLEANNQHPPMTLRINTQHHTPESYQQQLLKLQIPATLHPHSQAALTLEQPQDVAQLPGFTDGWLSVQDSAAQLAAQLLDTQASERVLDACAAPGGKSCHILERQPQLKTLVAIDSDATRLARVEENLQRLKLSATLHCADASDPSSWWNGEQFERILLDAPCSATGVIRRHPDIKLLRKESDIDELVRVQQRILEALWPLLKVGGRLLYATCSLLPSENSDQLSQFLARHPEAKEHIIAADWGVSCTVGRQILTGEAGMDGFYYGCIEKSA
ncbi:MAG: 16S rRNA (cytosine(967)-C(5))-methyltransferase RsmB [Gammaproteobacteria bacterium]|nr:16S rRNA (cytosine(967)-C(5))-methyltransferase RsmB [Gammaproteobacteria bacterium]MCF6230646.1 16S rRNA (cytosine(967)-C(5))-methyltransferase RsmB [Gammaproteobacteria bacterium]